MFASSGSLELAYVYEPWRVNREIGIDVHGARLDGISILGSYPLPPSVQLAQGFVDTYSVRLGGEYGIAIRGQRSLWVSGGLMYEPSAVPPAMLTPMALNLDTLMASVGVRYRRGSLTFEAVVAHLFMLSRTVTNSQISQINAVGAQTVTSVGNGTYRSYADIIGLAAQLAL